MPRVASRLARAFVIAGTLTDASAAAGSSMQSWTVAPAPAAASPIAANHVGPAVTSSVSSPWFGEIQTCNNSDTLF